jgi:hypothetical protein
MAEFEGGSVPGTGDSAGQPPDTTPAADTQQSAPSATPASGEPGLAPGLPADATSAVAAQGLPSATPPGEFVFGGRRFRSQKHAEDYWNALAGRVPETQRKVSTYESQIAELNQTVQALQRALSAGPPSAPHAQGNVPGGPTQPAGPKPFAERLVESGDLAFITQLAEEKGLGHAIYALADLMGNEINGVRDQIRNEEIQPMIRQQEFSRIEGRALGVARNLGSEFPELENSNQSPEAVEAQQSFVETLKRFPPEFVAADPELAMLATALVTRYQHGVPMVGQQPGSSGSPSARAAMAAEQALGTPNPLDGSATRPNLGKPGLESPADRIRRENQQAQNVVRTPDGRVLFTA